MAKEKTSTSTSTSTQLRIPEEINGWITRYSAAYKALYRKAKQGKNEATGRNTWVTTWLKPKQGMNKDNIILQMLQFALKEGFKNEVLKLEKEVQEQQESE